MLCWLQCVAIRVWTDIPIETFNLWRAMCFMWISTCWLCQLLTIGTFDLHVNKKKLKPNWTSACLSFTKAKKGMKAKLKHRPKPCVCQQAPYQYKNIEANLVEPKTHCHPCFVCFFLSFVFFVFPFVVTCFLYVLIDSLQVHRNKGCFGGVPYLLPPPLYLFFSINQCQDL